ncbi:MAG TPA: peptidoglycan-associated lipoprotein Pal [Thermoanaerobaculia bacterium]|nr:peptidoglycan-associated lipoprotein Pal [Thermoanaerobaculia bacterium]
MRSTRLLTILCVLPALLLLGGCNRKNKVTTAPEAAPETTGMTAAPASPSPAPEPGPAPAPEPDPLSGDLDSVNEYLRRQGLLGDIYFQYDEASLSGEARERLAQNARFLTQYPQFRVTLEGHCDERGTSEYNLALGERRAASVRDYLVSLGVTSDRLSTISYGKEKPACADEDESCWSLNRRAHPVVTGRSGG